MSELRKLLADLTKYSKLIYELRLTSGPGGNTSARLPGGKEMYIKPSGLSFAELEPEDFVAVKISNLKKVGGRLKPSSELALHAACYMARKDVNAVFHAHPATCIALSALGQSLDIPLYPDHVVYLGKVSFVPYVTPTTRELAEMVSGCVRESNCILLQNHGTVSLGSSVKEAFYRTELMEESAKIILYTKLLGKARTLLDEEVRMIESLGSEAYRKRILGHGQ
ncbi:MAG: class II aldolase/adducin family protein [Thermoproteota archaeon]